MSVTVRGAATLERTLQAAARSLAGPGMTGAVRATATDLTGNVRARTPRRTGRLAASVRPVPGPDRLTAAVAASAPYARPIEGGVGPRRGLPGAHNVRARRMLARGAAATGPAAAAHAAAAVQQIIRRVRGA